MHAPEGLDRLVDHALAVSFVGHVGDQREQGVGSGDRLGLCGHTLYFLGLARRRRRHLGAMTHQAERHGASETAPGTRHDGDLARQNIAVHRITPRRSHRRRRSRRREEYSRPRPRSLAGWDGASIGVLLDGWAAPGVRNIDVPATPERIWPAIGAVKRG